MVAEKNWAPPKQVHPFHYYITDIAVQKFREKAHVEHKVMREFDLAVKIDQRVYEAADKMQDIVDAANNSQLSKIVEIVIKRGQENPGYEVRMYAVLREIRPNQYPVPRTVGGPGGVGLCVITLIDSEQGANNFATGRWKPANLALAKPLQKLQNVQVMADDRGLHLVASVATDKPEDASTTKVDQPVEVTPCEPRRRYDAEFKQRAVRMVSDGKTQSDAARELEVSQSMISKWVRESMNDNDNREEKMAFARQQFELRPTAQAVGDGSVSQQLIDRFGSTLKEEELTALRDEMRKTQGVAEKPERARPKGDPGAAEGLADKIRNLLVDGVARDTTQVFAELKIPGITQGQVSISLSELMRRKNRKLGICRIAFSTYQMNVAQRTTWQRLQRNANPPTPRAKKPPTVAAIPAAALDLSTQLQEALALEAQKKLEYEAAKQNVSTLLKQMVESRK